MFKASISYHFGQKQCAHYYLAHYIPANRQQDELSKSLLRFKNNILNDLTGWIDYAKNEFLAVSLPQSGIIIRAHHSYEGSGAIFKRKPLDYLGNGLARELGWKYAPELIQKLWPTQKASSLLSVNQRKDEFRNNYGFNELFGYIHDTPVLIIDDIVTTGTTMTAILNALNDVCSPRNLSTFSLALTGYEPALNEKLSPHGNLFSFDTAAGWIKNPV
jgi:hypothetical protein